MISVNAYLNSLTDIIAPTNGIRIVDAMKVAKAFRSHKSKHCDTFVRSIAWALPSHSDHERKRSKLKS